MDTKYTGVFWEDIIVRLKQKMEKEVNNDVWQSAHYAEYYNNSELRDCIEDDFFMAASLFETLKGKRTINGKIREYTQNVRRFLQRYDYLQPFDKDEVEQLFWTMIWLEQEEALYDIIEQYYEEFIKAAENDFVMHRALNFDELYEAIGDYLLFQKGNFRYALKFYQLIMKRWEDETELINSETKFERWQKFCDEYEGVYYKGGSKNDVISKNILEVYKDLMMVDVAVAEEQRLEEFLEMLQQIGTNRELLEMLERERAEYYRHIMRCLCIMWLAVREKFWRIFIKKYREIDIIELKQKDALVEWLKNTDVAELVILKDYAEGLKGYKYNRKLHHDNLCMIWDMLSIIFDIRAELKIKDKKKTYAYYTRMSNLKHMLPTKGTTEYNNSDAWGKMSIMHVAYMNDPNEGQIVGKFLGLPRETEKVENRKKVGYPYVFLKCFTPVLDDLPMWEMYGDRAEGACMVINNCSFVDSSGNPVDVPVYHICYMRKEGNTYRIVKNDNERGIQTGEIECCLQKIRSQIESAPHLKEWFRKCLMYIQYLFKDADYKHEKEVRILYMSTERNENIKHTEETIPKLFIQPDISPVFKEMIIGPKVSDASGVIPYFQEQLGELARRKRYNTPEITLSSIEYR